uniref:BHLH domain-containing protein n=1 Tax=Chenopodium quinoa TaxID=63459 RepID=A0A803MM23_CHEQI
MLAMSSLCPTNLGWDYPLELETKQPFDNFDLDSIFLANVSSSQTPDYEDNQMSSDQAKRSESPQGENKDGDGWKKGDVRGEMVVELNAGDEILLGEKATGYDKVLAPDQTFTFAAAKESSPKPSGGRAFTRITKVGVGRQGWDYPLELETKQPFDNFDLDSIFLANVSSSQTPDYEDNQMSSDQAKRSESPQGENKDGDGWKKGDVRGEMVVELNAGDEILLGEKATGYDKVLAPDQTFTFAAAKESSPKPSGGRAFTRITKVGVGRQGWDYPLELETKQPFDNFDLDSIFLANVSSSQTPDYEDNQMSSDQAKRSESPQGTSSTDQFNNNPSISKKLNHNASERDRRKKINNMYSSLRSLLPTNDQRIQGNCNINFEKLNEALMFQLQKQQMMQMHEILLGEKATGYDKVLASNQTFTFEAAKESSSKPSGGKAFTRITKVSVGTQGGCGDSTMGQKRGANALLTSQEPSG